MGKQTSANISASEQGFSQEALKQTLSLSRKEAMASSAMTATCDNFINAFAIYLRASALQMGWLTAIPQLVGALMQLTSVWLGAYCTRKSMILIYAYCQAAVLVMMLGLSLWHGENTISWLILLVICYH